MSSKSQREMGASGTKVIRFLHWPLRQQPWRSLALLVAVAFASLLVARAAGNVWAGFTACLALIVCLWRMWLPVQFEFGPRGIAQNYLGRRQRVAWRDIVRCEFQPRGLLLHATDDTTAVGAMRSIFVRYPPQHEQLRELVEFEMSRWPLRTSSSIEMNKSNNELKATPSVESEPKPTTSNGVDEPPPPFVLS
jgi:hypothetical protein